MTARWAARVPANQAEAAARLRLTRGIEVLQTEDYLWLRGDSSDEETDRAVRSIAGAERFEILDDGRLVPVGRRVPTDVLPSGSWTAIRNRLAVELPPSTFAGRCDTPLELRLVRSTDFLEPGLLLAHWDEWCAYGVEAPQVRLDRWTFAVCADGRTLIRGVPLPPISGETYVESSGIAVPSGWRWEPSVDAETLRLVFRLSANDVALCHLDGTWERITAGDFAKATRSAIRKSDEVGLGTRK